MAHIEVEHLYKVFGSEPDHAIEMLKGGSSKDDILAENGSVVGVYDATFSVEEGEIFVIMGLSGSGKSTLLRCLNRLVEPTRGTICVAGEDVTAMNSEQLREFRRHKAAMVFQHFGLLPHRTVAENISFGLEIRGVEASKRRESALEMIEVVGLKGYEDSMTGELSGGMQQRVGLARALCTGPDILLMDEAFSALDPLIRSNMQDELLNLQERMRKTIVFITHDLDEALKIGDRIAIMKDGTINQIGTSEEIICNPADDYVRSFVENVDRGKVITAGTVMFDRPERVVIPREGPAAAIRKMRRIGAASLPATDQQGRFKGVLSIREAVRAARAGSRDLTAALDAGAPTTSPDVSVRDLLPLVWQYDYPVSVVDDEGMLLGIVTEASVISELSEEDIDQAAHESDELAAIEEELGSQVLDAAANSDEKGDSA